MLEARVYHKESDTFSGQLKTDYYGSDFSTILNNTIPCNYLTFDGKGINLIDENLKFYEEGEYIGYTLKNSGGDCGFEGFTDNDALWINLSNSYDYYPEKLTVQFKDYCCSELRAVYYNASGAEIQSQTIKVSSKYVTIEFLRGYNQIRIYFTKTVEPYQHIRIESVIYGTINVFNRFSQHNLIEEINVLSDDLPINQFEATIINPDPDNISFTKKDPLTLFSNGKYYGTFFLKNIQRSAKFLFDITAQNAISMFEKDLTSWATDAYGQIDVSNVISSLEMLTGINIVCESNIENEIIRGYHQDGTCRAALCELGYCLGQMADSSRNDKIIMRPVPTEITSVITTADRRIIGDALFKKKDVYSSAIIEYKESPLSDINQVTITNDTAEFENVKKFDSFLTRADNDTIFSERNANIQKYIQSRGTVTAKIRLRNERVGDLIQIETAWDGIITGIITKMNITFGYEDIADIEVLEWNLQL